MMSRCKNVFITGGNRGIGLELARQILDRFKPENLIVTCREPSEAKELSELGKKYGNLHIAQLDVTKFETYKELAAKVEEITGGEGLNLIINNAGVFPDRPTQASIKTLTRENLATHFEVNTYAPVFLTQALLPLLEKASSRASSAPLGLGKALLVNMTTKMGSIDDNTSGGCYSYRSSKTALNMLTKCISLELKEKGILTALMHPGWVKTDMGGSAAPLTVEASASGILSVLENLTEGDNGKFLQFDGKEIPW